jgi:hypothetical protein
MNKLFTTVTACAMVLSVGATLFAQDLTGGCNGCIRGSQSNQAIAKSDPQHKFQMDTIDLRQDMMNRRFEMQRENLKGTPDAAKIAGLKAEVGAIQARINAIRVQSGLPESGKLDGECYKMDGGCNKQSALGGCNGQPCFQK